MTPIERLAKHLNDNYDLQSYNLLEVEIVLQASLAACGLVLKDKAQLITDVTGIDPVALNYHHAFHGKGDIGLCHNTTCRFAVYEANKAHKTTKKRGG